MLTWVTAWSITSISVPSQAWEGSRHSDLYACQQRISSFVMDCLYTPQSPFYSASIHVGFGVQSRAQEPRELQTSKREGGRSDHQGFLCFKIRENAMLLQV